MIHRDRVALDPGLELVFGAVCAGVGAGVPALAVGHSLDQRRPVATASPPDRLGSREIDSIRVVAVDDDPIEAVGGGAISGGFGTAVIRSIGVYSM